MRALLDRANAIRDEDLTTFDVRVADWTVRLRFTDAQAGISLLQTAWRRSRSEQGFPCRSDLQPFGDKSAGVAGAVSAKWMVWIASPV